MAITFAVGQRLTAAALQTLADATVAGNNPYALLVLAGSITTSTTTVLSASSALANVGNMWSAGSPTIVTIPSTAWYEIGVELPYAAQVTAAGGREAIINFNGVQETVFKIPTTTYFNNAIITVAGVYNAALSSGTQVSFSAWQTSGATLALTSQPRAWVRRIAAP